MLSKGTRLGCAFTLIELLVSISIISLLISILLPSLRRAREQTRKTQCLARLRFLALAHVSYVNENGRFPDLNNEEDDGAWQYNYLIYDGRDFDSNFGPLIYKERYLQKATSLHCPVQMDDYHGEAIPQNPWPVVPLLDTRASYARRYHLSGKSFSQLRRTPAFLADLIHLPKVVKSAHKNGVNAAYVDGHAQWVPDPGILRKNELTRPFASEDNDIIEDIWDVLNRGG